jgi:hypothetical protein
LNAVSGVPSAFSRATPTAVTPLNVVKLPASGAAFPVGTTTVTCSATDAHGNTGTATLTITVHDTTGPVVTGPGNLTSEAISAGGAAVTFVVSAVDSVDGIRPVACTTVVGTVAGPAVVSGATFPLGVTTVTCAAQDAHGNVGITTFTVTVQDTTAPTLTVANMTVTETNAAGIVVNYAPVVQDAVSGTLSPVCSPTSGTTFAIGVHTVSCTATDAAGNSATATFTVTVLDGVPPVVTVPAKMTVEATSAQGTTVSFAAGASDNVDETLTPSCAPASNTRFGLGITTVICSATDAAGNIGSATFTVTVRDTTAPALTLPTIVTATDTSGTTTAVTYSATAVDIVDGVVAPVCEPASGSLFPIGSTTVTCTATDAHGNKATGTFTVKMNDGVAPTVTVTPSGNRTVEATSSAGAVVTFTASASDNYDTARATSCAPASASTFPLGITTVTCMATDHAGNVGRTSFNVTVVDTPPPVLTLPAPVTAVAYVVAGVPVTFSATTVDAVDGARAVVCSPASGSTVPGTTTVSCSASDTRGHSSTTTFTVTVTLATNRIGTFVAFSRDSTWLQSNATVVTGDVGANERRLAAHNDRTADDDNRNDVTVRAGQGAVMAQPGSRVVGDVVVTQARSSVYNVIANVFLPDKQATVLGTVSSPMAIPYLTLPAFPAVTAGTTAVTVANNRTLTLAAGNYGSVPVSTGATLILTGGLYQMLSLDVDPQATVIFHSATESPSRPSWTRTRSRS